LVLTFLAPNSLPHVLMVPLRIYSLTHSLTP